MIRREATLHTMEGDVVKLPIPKEDQYWEIELRIQCVDNQSGSATTRSYNPAQYTAHVRRDTLERAGLLPKSKESLESPISLEDLCRQVLEHLGVSFQEG